MCTSPIKILNPSRYIKPGSGQQLFLYVPCGHCVDCRRLRQTEYLVRTYHECLDTIKHGGYVLFDTLTYSDLYLPRVSDFIDVPKHLDFSCFRALDVQLFLKRLRINLNRKYNFDPAKKLRYFVASEYGSENKTFRPHYHLFFFIKDSSLDPLLLSSCISESWNLGRTDGFPYKSSSYVRFRNTFRSIDGLSVPCIKYISKYVTKGFFYSDKVKDRLFKLMSYFYEDYDWQMNKVQRSFFKYLCRFVSPFHLQSKSFGSSYIDYYGRDNLLSTGKLTITFDGLPRSLNLFPSLKRKLLYNHVRNDLGDVRFYLNSAGFEFKKNHLFDNIVNLDCSVAQYNMMHSESPIQFDSFDFLFNHNRLQDFPIKRDKRDDVYLQFDLSNTLSPYDSLRNYAFHDFDFMKIPIFTYKDYGSKKHGFSFCNKLLRGVDYYTLDDLKSSCCFFSSLDDNYFKLLTYRSELGAQNMAVARLKERLKQSLKSYNLC